MQIEIQLDESCIEPKVILRAAQLTDEVKELAQRLTVGTAWLAGFCGEQAVLLAPSELLRVTAQNGKVWAITLQGSYTLRMRLYEAEEKLHSPDFVRISHAEIINLKQVKNFDLSFSGTICVTLSNGQKTYVARRYVTRIKQTLGI
ncbi:MAG: LytTR family DNA-binding domain-containing protein [Pygmaiobacter sp.]|nr:LytTR family DNA-binding domain-containing protein [Pygmaiobacter sp.]